MITPTTAEKQNFCERARFGDLAAVKAFIEKFGNDSVRCIEQHSQSTALHTAAAGGSLEVIQFLLEKGADLNAGNMSGYTPLMWATSNNQIKAIEYLLDQGADPHLKNQDGQTVRNITRNKEIIDLLQRWDEKKEQERIDALAAKARAEQERLQKQTNDVKAYTPKIKLKPKP